jgi:hypothetical protein
MNTKEDDKRQHVAPISIKCWDNQLLEIDWAAKRLGTNRSALLRIAALAVARELRGEAAQALPFPLTTDKTA